MDVSGITLITGGASGIGRACAEAFAVEGATGIALLDINGVALAAVKNEITELANTKGRQVPKIETYVIGISDEEMVNRVISQAHRAFQRLDYVVNAAGISIKHPDGAAFCETSDCQRTLDINLTGTFFILRAAAKIMLEQEPIRSAIDGRPLQRGSIVNFSSIQGLTGITLSTACGTSKHTIIGLTETALEDYAKWSLIAGHLTGLPLFSAQLSSLEKLWQRGKQQ